jgi:hypothetical protein
MVGLVRYILLLFSVFIFSQEHILIGDSQTYLLAKHSTEIKQVKQLCQPGIGVIELNRKTLKYPVSPAVKSVCVCIGVNDGYKDRGISILVKTIKRTFPNARLFIIQGSWGWGTVRRMDQSNLDRYYKQFPGTIIYPAIGKGDPHRNKKVYKTIMKSLENQI